MTLTALDVQTIVGDPELIRNGLNRAREDGRLAYTANEVTLPDGRVALTAAFNPLPELTRKPLLERVWQSMQDGEGVIYLGGSVIVCVALSAVTMLVASVANAVGMVTGWVITYGMKALVLAAMVLVIMLVIGSKSSGRGGSHCPGPWHK